MSHPHGHDAVADEVADVEISPNTDVVNEFENPDDSITIEFQGGGREHFETEADPSAADNSYEDQAYAAQMEQDAQPDPSDPVDEQFDE